MATLLEYAKLANTAYTASTDPDASIPGWSCVGGMAVDDRSVFSGGSAFSSGLQMRAFMKSGTGEIVIAYKGTVPTMMSDLTADLRIVLEGIPRQAYDALVHTTTWKKKLARSKVTLTGHSLGGGIAQIAGAVTDSRFVTFNAPGMWTNATGICNLRKLLNTTRMGMNFINWHDAVGNFGKHVGDTTRLNTHKGHSIVGFIEYLDTYSNRDKDPLA